MRNPVLFIFLLIGVLVIASTVYLLNLQETEPLVTNFEECVRAGNPVLESYPRQCNTEDNLHFVENLEDIEEKIDKSNVIKVSTPMPYQIVEDSFLVEGEVRGTWFFEANLPYEILDDAGNSLHRSSFTTENEWMTEDFVPFNFIVDFEIPEGVTSGTFVIRKDNPSDIREFDDQLEIPIEFGKDLVLPEIHPNDPPVTTTTKPTNSSENTANTVINKSIKYKNISMTPTQLLEDSRCPVSVQCVWEGTVRLSVDISFDDLKETKVFVLNEPIQLTSYLITLVKVDPVPKSSKQIEISDYKFTFSFTESQ